MLYLQMNYDTLLDSLFIVNSLKLVYKFKVESVDCVFAR